MSSGNGQFAPMTAARFAALFASLDKAGKGRRGMERFAAAVLPYARTPYAFEYTGDYIASDMLRSIGLGEDTGLYLCMSYAQIADAVGTHRANAPRIVRKAIGCGLVELVIKGKKGAPSLYRVFHSDGVTSECEHDYEKSAFVVTSECEHDYEKGGVKNKESLPNVNMTTKQGKISSQNRKISSQNRKISSHVQIRNMTTPNNTSYNLKEGARVSALGGAPRATSSPACPECGAEMDVRRVTGGLELACTNPVCTRHGIPLFKALA